MKGRQVLKPLFEQVSGVTYSGVIDSVKLILSFEKWCHDDNFKEDFENAGTLISNMKMLIKKKLPRDKVCKKGNGWAIPKFHAISKYPYYIK